MDVKVGQRYKYIGKLDPEYYTPGLVYTILEVNRLDDDDFSHGHLKITTDTAPHEVWDLNDWNNRHQAKFELIPRFVHKPKPTWM